MPNIFFSSSYKIGLTALLTENAIALNKLDNSFVFLSGEKEQFSGLFKKLEKNNVNYQVIEGIDDHGNLWKLVKLFSEVIQKNQPSIIHVQTNWQLLIVVLARFISNLNFKIFYTLHGYRHNHKIKAVFAKYIIGLALYLFVDKLFVTSSFLGREFAFLKYKTEVLFLGVDENYFVGDQRHIISKTKNIIFPAEFREGKNQDKIILALHKYIQLTGDQEVKLFLPGKGEGKKYCQALSQRLGIEHNVFFPGFIDRAELSNLYKLCQFAVISSNCETFGLSIVEPFVLGKVVITRHVGVADDIIIDGVNGFFFDSIDDLVNVFQKILPDQSLIEKIVQNTKNSRDLFSWKNICSKYLKFITGWQNF